MLHIINNSTVLVALQPYASPLSARLLDLWDERYKREIAAKRTHAPASIKEHPPLLLGYLCELTDYSDMICAGRVPPMELGELEGSAPPCPLSTYHACSQ